MSDSLLTLLEILDQVVQEEELKEQASGGGAPTEQELWDAISPGLLDLVKDHLNDKLSSINRERVINGMTSQDLDVAFRILNELIREKKLDLVKDKVEYIAAWLVKLNYFHLENPDAGYAFQNQPKVIESLINSINYFDSKNLKKKTNLFLRYVVEEEFLKITPFIMGSRQGDNVFTRILEDLQNGIGVIATLDLISKAGKQSNAAKTASSKYILNKLDYEKLVIDLKNQKYKTIYGFLELARNDRNILPEPYKQFHIKYLINYLTKAFEEMYESSNSNYFVTLKGIYNYLTNTKHKDQTSVEKLPEILSTFFNTQFEKFSEKYKDEIQKGGSVETFTDPEVINRKTINNQALQTIIKEFFKDFNDNSMQGRIEHLTKKMDIFKSKDISSEMKKQNINSLDFINRVLMMEYFIKFSKEFDALTAGLLFEYFLAALFGGTATGERGDAVDFEVQSGGEIKLGSAKFISTQSVTQHDKFSQKISTFLPFIGKTITYIVGIKKESDNRFSLDKSNPLDIAEVDIYTFKARYEEENKIFINDKQEDKLIKKDRISFVDLYKKKKMKKIGTLQIMSTSEEGIRGFRQLVLESVNEQTKDLLQAIQNIFDHIKEADNKTRKYVSSGSGSDGFDAQKALINAGGSISKLGEFSDYEKSTE